MEMFGLLKETENLIECVLCAALLLHPLHGQEDLLDGVVLNPQREILRNCRQNIIPKNVILLQSNYIILTFFLQN